MEVISKERLLRDALDRQQKERRARQRYFAKHREIIDYSRDGRAKAMREKARNSY
jgi:hypothetical protein